MTTDHDPNILFPSQTLNLLLAFTTSRKTKIYHTTNYNNFYPSTLAHFSFLSSDSGEKIEKESPSTLGKEYHKW